MKFKTLILLGVCLPLFIGCYSLKYHPYAGDQGEWPTAAGSFVDTTLAVPTYYGLPPKPYEYLGEIQVNAKHPWVTAVKVAAKDAKARGADALLVLQETERPIGSSGFGTGLATQTSPNTAFGFGSSSTSVQYGGQAKAIAIRWKSATPLPQKP